jgi:hypothetical protein
MSGSSGSLVKTIVSASAWGFIGVLLAVAFFVWQQYRNPFEFKIELQDEFNLVEVRERIEDLKILYKDEDILTSKKQIKVIRITLRNTGNTILQQYYDQLDPFGLRFKNAKLLNAEVVASNSTDIQRKILPAESRSVPQKQKTGPGLYDDLILSKVIFEKDKYVTLKVTLIQDKDSKLDIAPLGKIANIDRLSVIRVEETPRGPLTLKNITLYAVAGYIGLILLLLAAIGITTIVENHVKKRKVKKFIEKHGELTDSQKEIINIYLDRWNSHLDRLLRYLIKGDQAFSLQEYVDKEISRLKTNPFISVLIRRIESTIVLPKEIFETEGNIIKLNQENAEFVMEFFRNVQ